MSKSVPKVAASKFWRRETFYVRLSSRDRVFFVKRLAFLVKAGVPMLESLHMLKRHTKSGHRAKLFDRVIKDVEGGQYLHTSLAKYRRLFGDFAVNLIKVGEMGGLLGQNLDYLALELEKKHKLKKKVIGALIYPVFILCATLAVTGLLIIFVFPRVLPIFKSLNVALPLTTRILIWVSDFLINNGPYVLIGLVLLVGLVWVLNKRWPTFRFWVDKVILKLPVFGRLAQNYQLTNFYRTLGLLLKSGVRSVEAVEITAGTMGNLAYQRAVNHLAVDITKGKRFSVSLEKYPRLFPDLSLQLVAIGEMTGNFSETLLYLAELYEQEVDDITKNLSSAMEPVLMVIMGLVVGFLAVSIITPIYEVTKNLNPRS